MAKRHLEQYDKNGNILDIYLNEEEVMVGDQTLAEKLADMEDDIGDAAQTGGEGTVTGVKVGSNTYEPTDGVVDISGAVPTSTNDLSNDSGFTTKTYVDTAVQAVQTALNNLMNGASVTDAIDTFNEVINFLDDIDTDDPTLANQLLALNNAITALQTALAGKISGIRANGASTTLPVDENGIVTLPPAGSTISPASNAPIMDGTASVGSSAKYAREDHVHPHDSTKLSKSDVSVETQGDGTVDINVKDDTYTVNLNHTHEEYLKVSLVNDASQLPATLDEKTIYGVQDSGEISVLYVGGVPFYGGGGTSSPILRSPEDDSTIDVGTIEAGQSSVEKVVPVKGKNLTQALTIAVTGTGYSIKNNVSSISATDANLGTSITIVCTNTAEDAAGTLSIASSEVSCDCDLVANPPTYEDLAGVKLTGTQWLQTDYYPNPDTEFTMKVKFDGNVNTSGSGYFLTCANNTSSDGEKFQLYMSGNSYALLFVNKTSTYFGGNSNDPQAVDFSDTAGKPNFVLDNSVISYSKGTTQGTFAFIPGGDDSLKKTHATSLKGYTMQNPVRIGRGNSAYFSTWQLIIYELTFTENGETVRHWVPKTKNGVAGLYDTVNNTFISSETETELVPISNS